jgi:hypothetical protein
MEEGNLGQYLKNSEERLLKAARKRRKKNQKIIRKGKGAKDGRS